MYTFKNIQKICIHRYSTHISIQSCIYIYIYIYIWTERERQTDKETEREKTE